MSETTDTALSAGANPEPVDVDDAADPIRAAHFVDLYTRPRRFFARGRQIGARKLLVPAIWLLGISTQLDRVDTEILRYQFGQPRATWQIIEPLVTGSWVGFWAFCMFGGAIGGVVLYFVAGWWYGLRVRWAGAKNFDKYRARHLYVWSRFIVAFPYVLVTIVYTFSYPNYLAASNAEEWIGYLFMALMFWSVGVSYVGVNASFELVRWRARLWFLVLPVLFYVFSLGLLVGLVAYFT